MVGGTVVGTVVVGAGNAERCGGKTNNPEETVVG